MLSKPLVSLMGIDAKLGNPLNYLDKAISKYGDIKTFFSKYKNPIGIELEIESVPSSFRQALSHDGFYWKFVEDHSLKVNGAEFVSVPLSGQNIDYAIHEVSRYAQGMNFLYSVRTSTHVHMNVSFMNYDELCSLLALSAYLEPLLYTMCDSTRKGNPYCYPISLRSPSEVLSWHDDLKYCGINTAPVSRQLTVEYRQLHGTNDWRSLRRWIQVLCKIYYFAKTTPNKEVYGSLREVIRTQSHENFIKRILGATSVLFPDLAMCDENLLWVLAFMDHSENA
jgi:hypothetical protein